LEPSAGKRQRLEFLMRTLVLTVQPSASVRYQLLHRAASAIITGKQYRAAAAVLLVHSFSPKRSGWPDYQSFTRLFGVEAMVGAAQRLSDNLVVPLFGLWVVGDEMYLLS
jgi:hypothetical protein